MRFGMVIRRADLEAKILEDNPSFEKSRVSEEASKLYKDAEVLNLMIKFNERMSDPEYRKAYEDMKNANRNVLFTYAGWLGTGLTLSYLNKNYVQPKLESGEWIYLSDPPLPPVEWKQLLQTLYRQFLKPLIQFRLPLMSSHPQLVHRHSTVYI